MKFENAKTLPKVYFGLHMVEGVAEYKEPQVNNGDPYRILVLENAIKKMDATFAGRPVYVRHVDDVNLDKLQEEAAGYVVKSFYNPADGKHWAEFIVVSDEGHRAIEQGWKLSNAYIPKKFSGGGLWHGVEYLKEVDEGEYEHLALVPNPRYEESIILTPEQFKEYNQQKEVELKKMSNSKTKEKRSMFSFFKKTTVENSAEFDSMSVILPKSKIEKTIAQIINEHDEHEMKKHDAYPMANMDHHVKINGKMMKLHDAMKHYQELCMKHDALEEKKHDDDASEKEEKKEHDDSGSAEHDKSAKEKVMEHDASKAMHDDESDAEALKKSLELAEHEIEEMEHMKKNKKKNAAFFDALKNAESVAMHESATIDLSLDQVARGKARYGSGK